MPQPAAPNAQPSQPRRPALHEVLPDCVELHSVAFAMHASEDGKIALPTWVQLSPAGEVDPETGEHVVRGRDGRRFAIGDPAFVIEGTELPMQFDWEHMSVLPAFWGGSSRAAGWIDEIVYLEKGDKERPDPGFWGRVERWTPEGRADVEQAYFRGLSPLVRYQFREPAEEGAEAPPPLLRGFANVALTNTPNLKMTLLHSEDRTAPRAQERSMTEEEKALRRRLGLAETATHAEVAQAVEARFAQLVPRTELELAHSRVQATEAPRAALAKRLGLAHDATIDVVLGSALAHIVKSEKDAHTSAVERELESARKAGKITPASVEHYRAMAATSEGLERIKALFATMPSMVGDDPHSDDNAPGPQGTLTPQQREIAHSMGLTDEEYLAALQG